jgi:hypothetical protein
LSVYLIANLEVKAGGMEAFTAAVAEMVPILEGVGWKLAGAFVTRVGQLNTVLDIWQLDDFNHMNVGWGAVARSPRFPQISAALAETVAKETLSFADRLELPLARR